MKKIVLVQPAYYSETRPYFGLPLSLLGISRILDSEGYQIKILNHTIEKDFPDIVVKEAKGAICVGITSITGYAIHDGLLVAKRIRQDYPGLPIVWGGWHPSILPKETAENEFVDIVVKGQGERTFTELVHALEKKKNLKNISGIVYKDKKGKVIENPDRPLESLDNFPPIPFHLVDIEKFIFPLEYGGKRFLHYYSSYGCPFRCSFCVEQIVNKGHWVGLSPENTVKEILSLKKKYKIDSISFADTNFFINEERARKFSQGLIKNKANITWASCGRTRQMSAYSQETWQLMHDSGLRALLIGTESGDDETLKYMHKDITVSDTLKFTDLCRKYGVKIFSSFLMGFPKTGKPGDCFASVEKEIKDAFKLVEKMHKINPWTRTMFSLYLPYPSTVLFETSRKFGLGIPKTLEDWSSYLISAEDAYKMKIRQKWVSRQQAKKILMSSMYLFFFLDPDGYFLATGKIKNMWLKIFSTIGFYIFKTLAMLRWKYKYFGLPIDFYLFNFLRKYSQLA